MGMTKTVMFVALAAWGTSAALAADPPARVKLEIRRAENKAAEGLTEATVPGSDAKVYLHKQVELTNDDIASARVIEMKEGGTAVEVVFTKEGQKKATKLSEDHADKLLAILVDGKVIAAPVVRDKFGEKVVITGKFTKAEAEKLVKGIKAD